MSAEIPPAPTDLPWAERVVWGRGYRQALADLLQLETQGGEVIVNGEVVYALTIGREPIE